MKRRIIAAVLALMLAGAGAVLLMGYVKGSDRRAMAGMETVNVLVVTALVPNGTPVEALGKLVVLQVLPVKAVAPGTLSSLATISGQVSTTTLQPGEQLFASRFADPASLEEADQIEIPRGMQQVSVSMERPRMLGAMLTPGATVGVFVSLAKDGKQPPQTHLVLHRVLVTRIGGDLPSPPSEGEDQTTSEPADRVSVTFALSAADAEKLVFGAEHGRLWLSLESSEAVTSGTQVVTPGNVNE
jgi:pilus assembly protein CpaB